MGKAHTKYSAEEILRMIRDKKDDFWSHIRETRPVELFHRVARRVPAYKDFLRKNKINPDKIKTFKDFQFVPPVDKKNYLRQYPLEKLCWDGTLKKPLVFAATSGSTGEPFYFPRSDVLDFQSSVYHELFLRNDPLAKKKSTLVVIGFGMGAWIGGLITYEAFERVTRRGYPLTILSAGVNKKEIFAGLKKLGHRFDQLILCGYPPFVKDIIDEAKDYNINWRGLHVRIVFATEAFSERFRDYIIKKAHIKNPYTDTMNIYGTVDLGTMAEETPLSILTRRIAIVRPALYKMIFRDAHLLPTLVQYNPLFINFDMLGKEILCTGDNALPLVRYAIGDQGGVCSYHQIERAFEENNLNLLSKTHRFGILKTVTQLPFAYIYARADFSTKLYGAIIYPEHVSEGLQHSSLEEHITGKFTMLTKTDRRHNEYLEINVELRPRVKETKELRALLEKHITEALLERNAEHRNNANMMPGRVDPHLVLWPHEHPVHFKPGGKQRWVKFTKKKRG